MLSDDLKTPQGVVEGTPVSFANAWKAQSNCPDRTERLDDPCSYSSDSGERLFASKVNVAISDRLVFNFVFVLFYTYTEGFISRLNSNRFVSDQEHKSTSAGVSILPILLHQPVFPHKITWCPCFNNVSAHLCIFC